MSLIKTDVKKLLLHILYIAFLITIIAFIAFLITIFDIIICIIIFVDKYILGIIGLLAAYLSVRILLHNWTVKEKYKREWNNNDKKYIAQRCYEDGYGRNKDGKFLEPMIVDIKIDKNTKQEHISYVDNSDGLHKCAVDKNTDDKNNCCYKRDITDEDNRDYYYLVDRERNEYHRIADGYTLQQLGYPKPSRKKEKCFQLSDNKYVLGEEIKLYNIFAYIKAIWDIKN